MARIPIDDLIPKISHCRNQHSMAFKMHSASKDAHEKKLLSSDYQGLEWHRSQPLIKHYHFVVSTVNYSDSEAFKLVFQS